MDRADDGAPMTCQELTTAMVTLQESAWETFHRRYYDWLTTLALARASSSMDPAEVVQLTFLRAVRHMKVFTCENALKRWLSCLMRCVVIDHSRQITRRLALLEKYRHWQEGRSQESDFEFPDLESALATLNDEDALLIRQKYLDGWSTKELAESCQSTVKAVESRLGRLRKELKIVLCQTSR